MQYPGLFSCTAALRFHVPGYGVFTLTPIKSQEVTESVRLLVAIAVHILLTHEDHMSSTICRCSTFCWRCSWPLYANPEFSLHPYSTAGLAVWYSTDSPSAGVAAAHTHLCSTRHRHPRLHDQLTASGQLEVRNQHAVTTKEDYCACYST